jgi:hypothetical protein
MKLLQELREGKSVTNLDQYISNNVLKQFAESKFHILNTSRRARILAWQELYVDYINKRNSN